MHVGPPSKAFHKSSRRGGSGREGGGSTRPGGQRGLEEGGSSHQPAVQTRPYAKMDGKARNCPDQYGGGQTRKPIWANVSAQDGGIAAAQRFVMPPENDNGPWIVAERGRGRGTAAFAIVRLLP
jgi:hypothetical protein